MKPEEPRYTLAEAEVVLGRRQCSMYGHKIIQAMIMGLAVEKWVCAQCDVTVSLSYEGEPT